MQFRELKQDDVFTVVNNAGENVEYIRVVGRNLAARTTPADHSVTDEFRENADVTLVRLASDEPAPVESESAATGGETPATEPEADKPKKRGRKKHDDAPSASDEPATDAPATEPAVDAEPQNKPAEPDI